MINKKSEAYRKAYERQKAAVEREKKYNGRSKKFAKRKINYYPKAMISRYLRGETAIDWNAFYVRGKENHWVETFIVDNMFEVSIEVWGSKEANKSNYVEVKNIKLLDSVVVDASPEQRAEIIRKIYRDLRKQYGDNLKNSVGEMIKRFSNFSDYDFGI